MDRIHTDLCSLSLCMFITFSAVLMYSYDRRTKAQKVEPAVELLQMINSKANGAASTKSLPGHLPPAEVELASSPALSSAGGANQQSAIAAATTLLPLRAKGGKASVDSASSRSKKGRK